MASEGDLQAAAATRAVAAADDAEASGAIQGDLNRNRETARCDGDAAATDDGKDDESFLVMEASSDNVAHAQLLGVPQAWPVALETSTSDTKSVEPVVSFPDCTAGSTPAVANENVPQQLSCLTSKHVSPAQPSSGPAARLHRSSHNAQLRAQRLQQELLLREMEMCPFVPQTNSGRVASRCVDPDGYFERALQWQAERECELQLARRQREEAALVDCTFRPAVLSRAPADSAQPASARLYPAAEAMRQKEAWRQQELARRAEEAAAECSFAPQTNKPSRLNAVGRVRSRYLESERSASQQGERAAADCTFAPQMRARTPPLSEAAARYLQEPAHSRLARSHSATPPLRRSASAPRRLSASTSTVATDASATTDGASRAAEAAFSSFFERQEHFQRRREEKLRAAAASEAAARNRTPRASKGSQQMLEVAASHGRTKISFLERLEERQRGHASARASTVSAASEADAECTFAPRINADARQRRARTPSELSAGDATRRARALEQRRAAVAAADLAGCSFKPQITTHGSGESRLKVASEPHAYLSRVKHHMALKAKVTACVRQANEAKELEQCTFHPQIHAAPAYVSKIASSMALARSVQPPPPPSRPEWR